MYCRGCWYVLDGLTESRCPECDRVGELAEAQGHHPDIHLAWGKVAIETWTHKIDGLTESDFVLAAKIDTLPGA